MQQLCDGLKLPCVGFQTLEQWFRSGNQKGPAMRSFSKAVFAFACALALLSISFIAVTAGNGDLANQVCALGGSFCGHPSLLLIPNLIALAWAFMLFAVDPT